MEDNIRKLVRKEYSTERSPGYEMYKKDFEGNWHIHGTKYKGTRSVYNLMEGKNFIFEVDWRVLSDVWKYINGKYGNGSESSKEKVSNKMNEISKTIKETDEGRGFILFNNNPIEEGLEKELKVA